MDNTALKKWIRTRASKLPLASNLSVKELASAGGKAQDFLIKSGDVSSWTPKSGVYSAVLWRLDKPR